jgi:outer membrane immunogenic protein
MKKLMLATVSMIALTSVTRAADIPAAMRAKGQMYSAEPVSWDGVYVGAIGGIARNTTLFGDGTFLNSNTVTHLDNQKAGGALGGLLGYNLQWGRIVYGIEGDWSWLNVKSHRTGVASDNDGDPVSTSYELNWLATVRGRAGLAFDTTMLYATGGVAFGHVKNRVDLVSSHGVPLVASFVQDQTKVGWTAGAGVEHMLAPHWTARAEFRFVALDKSSVDCAVTGRPDFNACVSLGYRGEFSNRLMLGLVGLAYKF